MLSEFRNPATLRPVEDPLVSWSVPDDGPSDAPTGFVAPGRPVDETARLAALRAVDILDTLPEPSYDDLATLAAQVCGTPTALITFLDEERMWCKANLGFAQAAIPRDLSFCGHALLDSDRLTIVTDARRDLRFATNPLVTGAPHIRFYAGAPIVAADGLALGVLCVVDTRPRALADDQARALEALARQVASLLALRKHANDAALVATRQSRLTADARLLQERGAELLDLVLQSGDLGLWDLHVPSGRYTVNARENEILGLDAGAVCSFVGQWSDFVHPDDLAIADAALRAHLRDGTSHYDCKLRVRHRDGRWLQVSSKAVVVEKDARGRPVRIVGTHRDVTAEHEARTRRLAQQQELERMSAMQEQTARLAQVGGWEADLGAGTVSWTDEVYRIHELERDDTPDIARAIDYYAPEARVRIRAALDAAVAHGTPYDLELPLTTARGRSIWVRSMGRVARRDGDVVTHLAGAFQDITERKEIELRLAESERRLRGITDNLPVLISELDRDGQYRFANATYSHWLGIDHTRLVGTSVRDGASGRFTRDRRAEIERALAGERLSFEKQTLVARGERTLQSTYVPHFDERQAVAGFYALTVDITDLKDTERRLDQLARIDSLTGLSNRRDFEERVAQTIAAVRATAAEGALMFLDIDRFKQINDTHGHAAGDEVLREFARRLRGRLRASDLVARHAGDEFVVVLDGPATPVHARAVADDLVRSMRRPMRVAGKPLAITTSIGIASYGGRDEPIDAVLSRADQALYRAKQAGRDRASA